MNRKWVSGRRGVQSRSSGVTFERKPQNKKTVMERTFQKEVTACAKALGQRELGLLKWKENGQRNRIDMAIGHRKKCWTWLIIREMQIRTTIRCHFPPVVMTIIKNQKTASAGEDVEKREPSCSVGGHQNWCSCSGKHHGDSSKN